MKKTNFLYLLATCFFIGHFPVAPGTIASIVAIIALYFLPTFSILSYIIILNILFFVGAVVCEKVAHATKIKDAPFIVIDEWFGMWLSLFLVPKNIYFFGAGLLIFRIFDVLKPKPISSLEKHAPGGLGIMLDDAVAGFFTLAILQTAALFLL